MLSDDDLNRKIWRNCWRCPQCSTKVARRTNRLECAHCGCIWNSGVDRPGAFAYTFVSLPLGLIFLVFVLTSMHGIHKTYGLQGAVLECCFWLVAALSLLGGIVGVATLLNWGRFRPRIVGWKQIPPLAKPGEYNDTFRRTRAKGS